MEKEKTISYRVNLTENVVKALKKISEKEGRSLKKTQEKILTDYAISKVGEMYISFEPANVLPAKEKESFKVDDLTDFELNTIKLRASIYNAQDIRIKEMKNILEHRNLSKSQLIEIDEIIQSNYYE